MVRTQEGSVLYVCTKFEADRSIPSKVIKGSQNFEIGSRDPGHAQLGSFCSHYAGRIRPLCLYQNVKRIAQFTQKL